MVTCTKCGDSIHALFLFCPTCRAKTDRGLRKDEMDNIARRARAVAIRLAGGPVAGRGMGIHRREGDEAVYEDVDGTKTRTAIPKLPNGTTMKFFESYQVRFLTSDDIDEYGEWGTVSCMPNGSVYLQALGGGMVINSNPVEGVDYEWQLDKK